MKKLNLQSACFFILFLLTITCTFSCKKSSSDNNNTVINAGGSWTGTVTQNANGTQAAETDDIILSLSQSGTNITGTFTKNGSNPATGPVSGAISGGNIALTCTSNSSSNTGGAALKGTINSAGTSMSGTLTALIGTDTGTWSVTKN